MERDGGGGGEGGVVGGLSLRAFPYLLRVCERMCVCVCVRWEECGAAGGVCVQKKKNEWVWSHFKLSLSILSPTPPPLRRRRRATTTTSPAYLVQ